MFIFVFCNKRENRLSVVLAEDETKARKELINLETREIDESAIEFVLPENIKLWSKIYSAPSNTSKHIITTEYGEYNLGAGV